MNRTLIGLVGRDLRRSLIYPFTGDVGVGKLLAGGAAVTFAVLVQTSLSWILIGDVPLPLDPTVEYSQAQWIRIYRALILPSMAFLLLMAPVYGYLLRMLQRSLSPNYRSRSEGFWRWLKAGFKLSVVGTLFTFHPQIFIGAWATELANTAAAIVGPELAYPLWIVVNLVLLAYVFPAVVTRFAWRRRLTDLVSVGWYRTTLTERRYAELALSIVVVQLALYGVTLVVGTLNPASTAGSGILAEPSWYPLLFAGSTISFYALVVQFRLIGDNWARVHRARTYHQKRVVKEGHVASPPERKLLYDPTTQRRLSAFATASTVRRSTVEVAQDRNDGPRSGSDVRSHAGTTEERRVQAPVPTEPRTPPESVPVLATRSDSLSESLLYSFRAEHRFELAFTGGLLVLLSGLVIPAFVIFGYLLEVLRRTTLGDDEPPAFEDWGRLLSAGSRGTFVVLVYAAVLASVSYLLLVIAAALLLAGYDLTGLVVIAVAVCGFWFAYMIPAALTAFAETGDLGSAFALEELRGRMIDSRYAVSWLVAVVVSLCAIVLTSLLLLTELGWLLVPFVGFYTMVSVARVVGRGCSTPVGIEMATSDDSRGRGAI